MTPDYSIRDVVANLRLAFALRRLQRTADMLLRLDIANVLAAGDREGFSEGWPPHWVPDNAFYTAVLREPDGMKRVLEVWYPWDACRN